MPTAQNVWAWSTTEADNATADSSINWSEGQDPATVNNSARNMMAAIARQLDVAGGGGGAFAVSGTDAISITTGQSISSGHQALGFRFCFKAAGTNTGAATVAVDGLTAVAIKRPNGDALSAGDIVSGAFYDLCFDGTNYKIMVPGASAPSGVLAGDNTWTGTNAFNGTSTTIGNDVADVVIIKGTTVNSTMSALLSNSSIGALRTAIGLGTADNVQFNGVTASAFNAAEYQYGGVSVTTAPTFISAMLGTLTQVGVSGGWGPVFNGYRLPARTTAGAWGYILLGT